MDPQSLSSVASSTAHLLHPAAPPAENARIRPEIGRRVVAYPHALDHDVKRRLLGFLSTCRIQGREALIITVAGGSVRLQGLFHSAHDRQLCVENCRRMTGVVEVIDETQLAAADGAARQPAYRGRAR